MPSQSQKAVTPLETLYPHATDCQTASTRMVAVVSVSETTHALMPARHLCTWLPQALDTMRPPYQPIG